MQAAGKWFINSKPFTQSAVRVNSARSHRLSGLCQEALTASGRHFREADYWELLEELYEVLQESMRRYRVISKCLRSEG